jgi:hypothetical protein
LSFQLVPPFASASWKPSFTKLFVSVSNSRMTIASAPPRERLSMQRLKSGRRQSWPL